MWTFSWERSLVLQFLRLLLHWELKSCRNSHICNINFPGNNIRITREVLLKGKAHYSWPLCTNQFRSAPIYDFFTKQVTSMRRSTVLTLPPHLVFPANTKNCTSYKIAVTMRPRHFTLDGRWCEQSKSKFSKIIKRNNSSYYFSLIICH